VRWSFIETIPAVGAKAFAVIFETVQKVCKYVYGVIYTPPLLVACVYTGLKK